MANQSAPISAQMRWAQFRFSVVGPLLAAPPEDGKLKQHLVVLANKQWRHPINGTLVQFGASTLERWYYKAKRAKNPVEDLQGKQRSDAACPRKLSSQAKLLLRKQYDEHPCWSYQLHYDNLKALTKSVPEMGVLPTYHTVRRYLKANGCCKRRRVRYRDSAGALLAKERLESREVRSFEMDYVHSLWHLDFHHGSARLPSHNGEWVKAYLLAVLDDRSRIICHAQWYLDESAHTLVHGFTQALQKRGLPRALMTDNGAAMMSAEFTQGLERLSILHQPTLPYSPYQNAKQEVFWAQIEGRLMAMLEGEAQLSLALLNEATQAWVELEYHHAFHSELQATPMTRLLHDKHVGRECPSVEVLQQSFCQRIKRRQRRSDGTITIEGKRFELPNAYRHFSEVSIQYARWDLSRVYLVDANTGCFIQAIYPQDKSANATGARKALTQPQQEPLTSSDSGIAPLLKELMAEYAATGLPPAYIPKTGEKP